MGDYLALAAIALLVIVGGVLWWKRRRAQMYDLRYWNVDPPGEAYDDIMDEESGPYCFRCDHANPPGTSYCQSCGSSSRRLVRRAYAGAFSLRLLDELSRA